VGSPIAVRVGDDDQIVLSGQQAVVAYDPETGKEIWRAEGNTFEAIPTHCRNACVAGPRVVVGDRGSPTRRRDVTQEPVDPTEQDARLGLPFEVLEEGVRVDAFVAAEGPGEELCGAAAELRDDLEEVVEPAAHPLQEPRA
jgi:hypothetical protein